MDRDDVISNIKKVLASESEAIMNVSVGNEFKRALMAMYWLDGKVITSGMGKAGHVARKFAATLSSTKTPAVFVHPGEAAHGDLGVINNGDILFVFSTSGKTTEVINFVRHAKKLKMLDGIIGVTSHGDSLLREESDIVLDMGVILEPCPLGLTPSASTTVMMAISDAIALTLLKIKGVTKEDFGLRHHGGYLGRKACE